MAVYVDQFPAGWGKWSYGGHMLASNLEELHAMANKIGLYSKWFQDRSTPHYDLTASKRILAIREGAIQIEIGEIPPDSLVKHNGQYMSYRELHGGY